MAGSRGYCRVCYAKQTRPLMDIDLTAKLDRIEGILATLVERQVVKDWYSTEESRRISARPSSRSANGAGWAGSAKKQGSGRGAHAAWVISHQELLRYREQGLLSPTFKAID